MKPRFTIDGSPELESQLQELCCRVSGEVRSIVPPTRLAAVILGGGYGRGEGGVLRTSAGDRPYNDADFYVFVRGNRLLAERLYGEKLARLSERLSATAGFHVEFKLYSLARFLQEPTSMFSYDLVWGHRVVYGPRGLFDDAPHHFKAAEIPVSEATRLLFNRCSGLLLAREYLRADRLEEERTDFVARNIAKARLALGDAVLAVFGLYHWSCLERHRRTWQLGDALSMPWLEEVRRHHAAGVEFKLRPAREPASVEELRDEHAGIAELSRTLWLWIEGRRLNRVFRTVQQYATCPEVKCPGQPGWRNLLLNLRSFGWRGALGSMSWRYPRERLLNSLPLLLWDDDLSSPQAALQVREQLQARASDREGLVAAYKSVWPAYG